MSQIKFACPGCNQHIQAGVELCEHEVTCPTCQTTFVAPPAPATPPSQFASPNAPAAQTYTVAKPPGSATFLAWYFIIGSIPFILFALFGFTIPAEDLTNHPDQIDRDRGFLNALKLLMFGGMLIYALAHTVAGMGLIRSKKWGWKTATILSILGAFHLNPFAIPGLIICFKKDVKNYYGTDRPIH